MRHIECLNCKRLLGYLGGETTDTISVQPCDCQSETLKRELLWVECPICKGFMNFSWKTSDTISLTCECQCLKKHFPPHCWYKVEDGWKAGLFHQWSLNYEEFETGPGNFPVAIIKDTMDCRVRIVYAGDVSFNPEDPDEANKALVGAAEDYKAIKFDNRFIPRLMLILGRWAVQVNPETIEIFNDSRQYVCQVKWVDGELVCPHGGLPRDELEQIFREANA